MISEKELRWMRENKSEIEQLRAQAEQQPIMSIYTRSDGVRAVCRNGKCIEMTGIVEQPALDNFDYVPQVGWRAGQLREIGFVKQN